LRELGHIDMQENSTNIDDELDHHTLPNTPEIPSRPLRPFIKERACTVDMLVATGRCANMPTATRG
jgi:hypothetical protein